MNSTIFRGFAGATALGVSATFASAAIQSSASPSDAGPYTGFAVPYESRYQSLP